MKLEAKIGLFVVLGLVALMLLSTQVNNLAGWNQKGYRIYAHINDATGLERQADVSMNGVKIGTVDAIAMEGRQVKLTFMIAEGVLIAKDSVVLVAQESVLGSKMVNILQGSDPASIEAEGLLENFKQYAALDETSDSVNAAAREIELLMKDLREVLDETRKEDLRQAITSFRGVGEHLDALILENRVALGAAIANFRDMGAEFTKAGATVNADLPNIMKRIDALTSRLDNISAALEHSLPEAVDKFIAIEDNVTTILEENRASLSNALTSADSFFDSGQHAFDKVDSLLSNFTVSELQVGMHAEQLIRDADSKVYLHVAYLPNPETYYLLDMVSMGDYTRPDIEPSLHEEGKTYISAQYGKRFGDLMIRGGLIEGTGGIGIDWYADKERLKISAEAFDFNAVNDIRGERAHAKVMLQYRFLKHLEVYGGWDNLLNSRAQNIFLGVGIRFIDNNLKYLLGSSAAAM
ncbi:MAG: MCE family protein [Campylobacterales bacterium]|nr:MCE family protein [Campylobacterales bacterium]